VFIPAPGVPRSADLERAAALLNGHSKVVMLVGAGALQARDEVLAVAAQLGSPIVKTLSGKAAVPDDHPLATGGIGLLGTRPSEEAMEGCDAIFNRGLNQAHTGRPRRRHSDRPRPTDPTSQNLRRAHQRVPPRSLNHRRPAEPSWPQASPRPPTPGLTPVPCSDRVELASSHAEHARTSSRHLHPTFTP
jgi:hypothetical protein